jgi:hypothetical protein
VRSETVLTSAKAAAEVMSGMKLREVKLGLRKHGNGVAHDSFLGFSRDSLSTTGLANRLFQLSYLEVNLPPPSVAHRAQGCSISLSILCSGYN